ncbi:cilia- and flagella-associated protein HOATZ-like [Lytechinus variegatus]|uniref:cilia- and flagella-associated protein HOATZ-like n=1 Tax=Lytechinus variegatus TaxID=7654 RepID=UPI001BB1BB5C|nr:cilia- and flagella-associated protein HOATZ-like [Lytechinus variegatus]
MASTISGNFFGSDTNHLSGEEKFPEMTEFSGSSDEDKACAKLFWQSVTLHPPIESRLVSGDIRQRLPNAGPFLQDPNYAHAPEQDDPKLRAFLGKAHAQMVYEESENLTKLAMKRQETRMIHQKRQAERKEKEKISHRTRKPLVPEDDYEILDDEAMNAMDELDQFDKTLEERSQKNLVL